jgi:hypothetical protein
MIRNNANCEGDLSASGFSDRAGWGDREFEAKTGLCLEQAVS